MRFVKIMGAFAAGLACLALSSCEEKLQEVDNERAVIYFDAWMKKNGYFDKDGNPLVKRVEPGIYVIEEVEGTGASLANPEEYGYIKASYVFRDFNDKVKDCSDKELAQWVGLYDGKENYFYGPRLLSTVSRQEAGLYAAMEAALSTMKVGGKIKYIAPGWLNTSYRFKTEKDYRKYAVGENLVVELEVVEAIKMVGTTPDSTLYRWEKNIVDNFVKENYPDAVATDLDGCYYLRLDAPSDTNTIKSESKVYINYTGRTMDGRVFDTTVADTAFFYGLSSNAQPVYVNWADEYTDITMGESESSLVRGFTKALFGMKVGERGLGIFHSSLGYGTSGTGGTILPCTPLIFELQVLAISSE